MQVLGDERVHALIPSDPPVAEAVLRERFARLSSRLSPDGREYWLNWVVFRGGEAVGTVQATVVPVEKRADIAYLFHPHFWGFGYATEAVAKMLEHLSDDLQIACFAAAIDTRNQALQKLVERLGFVRVGETKGADTFKGSGSDGYRYELNLLRAKPVEV